MGGAPGLGGIGGCGLGLDSSYCCRGGHGPHSNHAHHPRRQLAGGLGFQVVRTRVVHGISSKASCGKAGDGVGISAMGKKCGEVLDAMREGERFIGMRALASVGVGGLNFWRFVSRSLMPVHPLMGKDGSGSSSSGGIWLRTRRLWLVRRPTRTLLVGTRWIRERGRLRLLVR